jgi:hypothetical protein
MMRWLVLTAVALTVGVASLAVAQGEGERRPSGGSNIGDRIPEAALLTERGRQLSEELRRLRRTESSLGERHPSIATVREKIAAVEEQLQAWLPKAEGNRPLGERLPEMNPEDVKQLVLRLSAKIDQLERRVNALENRLEVF